MQLRTVHLLAISDFDIFKSQQAVAQKLRFWAENGNNFKTACSVLKISKIRDH